MPVNKNIISSIIVLLALFIIQASTQIKALDYAKNLGKGFDVTWSEFGKYIESYKNSNQRITKHFSQAGFKNVRIRMNLQQPTLNATFMLNLKKQVTDSIKYGIYPILAYQGFLLEESTQTHEQNQAHLADWWEKMAIAFKGQSYMLSFNILIEISGRYKNDYTNINKFYAQAYKRIRNIDPYRVIIFPPVQLSDPDYLKYLILPGDLNEQYVFAEWHFYAAGPNPDPKSKKYWLNGDTQAERNGVLDPIKAAVDWMNTTKYSTWVGAWMAGNYNKGNTYSIEQQVRFGTFMAQSLAKYNIPWSINADNKFYNFETYQWFVVSDTAGIAVRDGILDPEKVCIYPQLGYKGECLRLSVGLYDRAQLNTLNFVGVGSLMVPYGFQVKIVSGVNLLSQSIFKSATPSIVGLQVTSVEITRN